MCRATLLPEPDRPLRMMMRTRYGYPPGAAAASGGYRKPDGVRDPCAVRQDAIPVGLRALALPWAFMGRPSLGPCVSLRLGPAMRGALPPHDGRSVFPCVS